MAERLTGRKNSGKSSNTDTRIKPKVKPKVNPKVNAMIQIQQRPVTAAIQDMLGTKLQAYYSEIVSEPIPDRIKALMAKLEAQSATKIPVEPDAENGGDI